MHGIEAMLEDVLAQDEDKAKAAPDVPSASSCDRVLPEVKYAASWQPVVKVSPVAKKQA